MFSVDEGKLIKANVDLFNFHEEKEKRFLEIWESTKKTMEEVNILN
jgi:hypothetical protein